MMAPSRASSRGLRGALRVARRWRLGNPRLGLSPPQAWARRKTQAGEGNWLRARPRTTPSRPLGMPRGVKGCQNPGCRQSVGRPQQATQTGNPGKGPPPLLATSRDFQPRRCSVGSPRTPPPGDSGGHPGSPHPLSNGGPRHPAGGAGRPGSFPTSRPPPLPAGPGARPDLSRPPLPVGPGAQPDLPRPPGEPGLWAGGAGRSG